VCQSFSFRGLQIKKFRYYFRHSQKLHTSQQQQWPIQYAHVCNVTMAAASRAFGPTLHLLLEHDDCAACVCGLQLACMNLANRQRPVQGMGMCDYRKAAESHHICDIHHGWVHCYSSHVVLITANHTDVWKLGSFLNSNRLHYWVLSNTELFFFSAET